MLEIKNVTKRYHEKKGIFDIDVSFAPGTITGILGSNGSGKTTLFRSILHLCTIDQGEIILDGKSIIEQYQRIAFISESGSFLPYQTPRRYGQFLQDFYERFDLEKYEAMLASFHIDLHHAISTLSKGQQLKVELAAGFSMHADVLLLDEPFTTLDLYAKEDTIQYLLEQYHEQQIVLLATHNIEEIEHIIDRCIILNEGKIVEDRQMEALCETGNDLRTLLEAYRPEKK